MKGKNLDYYSWVILILFFGISLLGIGKDFPIEWKITWFIMVIIGWQISKCKIK